MKYEADICLVLEGTYPFVRGGVSSWVHSIVVGLSEFTFSLLVILPDRQHREHRYELPPNVIQVHTMFLQDKSSFKKKFWRRTLKKKQFEDAWELHQAMPFVQEYEDQATTGKEEFETLIKSVDKCPWDPASMLYSKESWKMLVKGYHFRFFEESFTDHMWNWRYLHAGIFGVLKAKIPRCRMYHTVCTGYAGLLAARARVLYQRPLILTEHGIYSKERKIEISKASWIFEKTKDRFRAENRMSAFKLMWINAFRAMSRFCYDQSSEIITLYGGNQRLQIDDGSPLEKMSIIPNGVDFVKMSALERQPQEKPIIGFVGRVVQIKDIKTFIRAMKLVANAVDPVEIWVMGPTEEEPNYYQECADLVESLDLSEIITFTGNVNLSEYYPKIDILVLTSLSEGQPLVILEAQCLAVPVVATDVGACRELLEGREEDRHLGLGGIITGLSNSEETAEAVISILTNSELAEKMGKAGQKRMQEFYDLPIFYQKYRNLYKTYIEWQESDLISSDS